MSGLLGMDPSVYERLKSKGRIHPELPDVIQVIVHDGVIGESDRRPILSWVRVTECDEAVLSGTVISKDIHLRETKEGSHILFIVPDEGAYLLQITRRYILDRSLWRLLMPCKTCGLTELFNSPFELVGLSFPCLSPDELRQGFIFTTRCGWCGGGMVIRLKRNKWPWS
jgi:hypothetical protein